MNNDMKCPVCKKKLRPLAIGWCCDCGMCGDKELWQELIRTREELHKANAELDYIKEQVEKSKAFIGARIKVAADQIARGIIAQAKNIKSKKDVK